jgi:hypothetical protein
VAAARIAAVQCCGVPLALVPPESALNCAVTPRSASATSETAPAPVALEVRARFVVETLVVGGGVTARFLVLGAGGVAGCAWMQLVMSTTQLHMQELTIGGGEGDQLLMSSSSSPIVS